MHRPVTFTFSTDHGFAANDCRAEQSRPAEIAADPRDEFEHHLPSLRAFALVLVGRRALADDIVARTIVAAWANIDAYDRGTRVRVWLFRTLRSIYFAQRRLSGRGATREIALNLRFLRPPSDTGAADPHFLRTFRALPAKQREALILIGPAGLSLSEAAFVCGCTSGSVWSQAQHGHGKLAVMAPPESRAANTAGRAPLRLTGAHPAADAPGGRHRIRLAPPDGRGPSPSGRT